MTDGAEWADHSPRRAARAAEGGHLHQWVLQFLRGSGANTRLAAILEPLEPCCSGLTLLPIRTLSNLVGSTPEALYFEDEATTFRRVECMRHDMGQGWEAPPIIATDLWQDRFEIADGAHRQVALLSRGVEVYPTIIYRRHPRMPLLASRPVSTPAKE